MKLKTAEYVLLAGVLLMAVCVVLFSVTGLPVIGYAAFAFGIYSVVIAVAFIRCPYCGRFVGRSRGKYCPHCGSKLDR